MTRLRMPDGREVEQGGEEDRATWWTCSFCGFVGPHVGENAFGEPACLASCGGLVANPNVPRLPSNKELLREGGEIAREWMFSQIEVLQRTTPGAASLGTAFNKMEAAIRAWGKHG